MFKRFLCAALCALMLLCAAPGYSEAAAPQLEVYFLDLGRVDGILLRCDGATAFIDVGFHSDAKLAIRWLRAMGIEHLDSYIGTHGHYDHIEGAPDMIEAFRPDTIYLSHIGVLSAMLECATEEQQAVIAETNRVILVPGDQFKLGPAKLMCVGPMSIVRCYTGDNDENDNSLILRLDYGRRSFLFTGDTTDAVLRSIDKRMPGILEADVLKNPHHNGSHDDDVLDLILPKLVVFCTDDSNPPRESYAQLLQDKGIRTLCLGNANQGSVAVVTDGESLEIRCGTAVQSVELPPISDMYPGQTLTPRCAVDPADALVPGRQLGWNSSDESVVVAEKGVLTAVAPGTATVTAVAINGVSGVQQVRVMDTCLVLDEDEITIAQGETKKLSGKLRPKSVKGLTAEWSSEDPSVATVSDGAVTGVGEGITRVVAQLSNGARTYCDVTVKGQLAKSIALDSRKVTMKVGDTLTLNAAVTPDWYDTDNLEWTSSDESVLWVDGYGNITAVRKGKAKVTVTASKGVSETCTVKVTD